MTGMSLASSLNREDLRTSKKRRSSTADAIFEKEFKEKATKDQALKCKLKEIWFTTDCEALALLNNTNNSINSTYSGLVDFMKKWAKF